MMSIVVHQLLKMIYLNQLKAQGKLQNERKVEEKDITMHSPIGYAQMVFECLEY